ncbi:MAG: family transcriptional regulator [Gammaproteobacteria bacterium]|jgi:transcriptional regulator with XRE-family HTH domain|nr:family transcriptional regulator [Gammaproteobacteria bacterium]
MAIKLTDDIAKRVRAARKAVGFKSAKDFASKYNIPLSTYSQHETGKRSINAELIINYSSYFQINPCWLLTGHGEPFFGENQQDKKDIIEREVFSISPKINDQQNKYNQIELALLRKILLAAEPLFEDKSSTLSYPAIVNHCLEIYDTVSKLDADMEEKEKIINLTLSTIKHGN